MVSTSFREKAGQKTEDLIVAYYIQTIVKKLIKEAISV